MDSEGKEVDCKRLMCSEGGELDRLSSLPDSVLVRILSFLPAQDAVRTCLLIRAFRDLWTNIDSLNFDDSPSQRENQKNVIEPVAELHFIRFIHSFLHFHKRSRIHEFRLKLSCALEATALFGNNYYSMEKHDLENEVERWIKVALSRGVEVLDLGFGMSDYEPEMGFKLPHFVWTNKTLVKLSLSNCDIGLPELVQMDSLKILKLDTVSLSNEVYKKIITSCQLLRDLTISDCGKLGELSFSAPNIETLHVSMMEDKTWSPIVNCPNVRYFNFFGFVDNLKLINLSSLKIASFCVEIDCNEDFRGFHKLKRLLEKIQHAEILKLNKEAFAVLTYRVVKNHPVPCNKWKYVQIETWLNDKYISGIRSLLRYSSHLEELTIEIKYPSMDLPEDIEHELHANDYVGVNNRSSEWLIHDLKKITMRGFFKSLLSAQIDLIKAILKNAHVLDRFHIFVKGNTTPFIEDVLTCHELFNISKELPTFPRASKRAMVLFK